VRRGSVRGEKEGSDGRGKRWERRSEGSDGRGKWERRSEGRGEVRSEEATERGERISEGEKKRGERSKGSEAMGEIRREKKCGVQNTSVNRTPSPLEFTTTNKGILG